MKTRFALAILTILCGLYSRSRAEDTIRIWVKAFIPNTAPNNPGYFKPVPGQPGKFMVPDPAPELLGDTLGTWVSGGVSYMTDHRGFSSDPASSARVTTDFTFIIPETGAPRVEKGPSGRFHSVSSSESVNPQTGATIETKAGALAVDATGGPHIADGKIQLIMQVSTGNPLALGNLRANSTEALAAAWNRVLGWGVGKIDYDLDFVYDTTTGDLKVRATVARFPAFEGYVSVNGGPARKLFTVGPLGKGALGLFEGGTGISFMEGGFSSSRIEGTINLSSLDGTWESNDPAKRFVLEIKANKCRLSERNSAGATIARDVPLISPPTGQTQFRIERANTDTALLTFLGYSPKIQEEILKRSPQSSFLLLSKAGPDKLNANWGGLLVTKDMKAQFAEMKQPGTTPLKDFVFVKRSR